jgi:hypothetical protein
MAVSRDGTILAEARGHEFWKVKAVRAAVLRGIAPVGCAADPSAGGLLGDQPTLVRSVRTAGPCL